MDQINSNRIRSFLLWIALVTLAILVFNYMKRGDAARPERTVGISEFLDLVERGEIVEATIDQGRIHSRTKSNEIVRSYSTNTELVYRELEEHDVKFAENPASGKGNWGWILILKLVLPIALLWGFLQWNKKTSGNFDKAQDHRKSQFELIRSKDIKTRFTDVAGVDEAVDEVKDLVTFLKNPSRFTTLGGRAPKGIMLVGPSGTGKTLLARAMAGEAGVAFISASASGFIEMFVGVGAARVRDLFTQARRHAPCIIFIDEIDAIGRKRGGAGFSSGGHNESEQTLNELLVQMDGFSNNAGVIIIAATNRPEILDQALTRAGRFDRQVVLPKPDLVGREAILKVHARGVKLATDVDLSVIARGTPGMTGADLEELLNEAALRAAKADKKSVDHQDVAYAFEKVIMGPERKSSFLTPETKRTIAFHEAGHALVGWFTPGCDPVHMVSIIPRGLALGVTLSLPERDMPLYRRSELLAQIKILLGGRMAENLVFGDVTTGVSNDLERATNLAHHMICDYAMTDEPALGLRTFGAKNRAAFLDSGYGDRDFSETTATLIDGQIVKMIADCNTEVEKLLSEKRELLNALAQVLLERETIYTPEITQILGPRRTL
ncbi:MAG: ATP-dependent zinc metalloprotease FtsH [Patescibacteria group bacterium]|jgi:cell division protease FtsH